MTSLKFSSEAEEAVKDVRDDSTSTNWVALTYDEGCNFYFYKVFFKKTNNCFVVFD